MLYIGQNIEQMKIPKQIFFIWIGNKLPDYVKFTINAFKQVNPDFNVDLITSGQDVDYCNKILNNNLNNNLNNVDKHLYKQLEYNFEKELRYIKHNIVLSHLLRIYLIYKYGGIYLDCDTFPVKPFDDKLLSNECFLIEKDNFFFGSVKNNLFDNNRRRNFYNISNINNCYRIYNYFYNNIKPRNSFYKNKLKYLDLNKKYYNLQLKYGECVLNKSTKDYYIDHYFYNSWSK